MTNQGIATTIVAMIGLCGPCANTSGGTGGRPAPTTAKSPRYTASSAPSSAPSAVLQESLRAEREAHRRELEQYSAAIEKANGIILQWKAKVDECKAVIRDLKQQISGESSVPPAEAAELQDALGRAEKAEAALHEAQEAHRRELEQYSAAIEKANDIAVQWKSKNDRRSDRITTLKAQIAELQQQLAERDQTIVALQQQPAPPPAQAAPAHNVLPYAIGGVAAGGIAGGGIVWALINYFNRQK